MGVHATGTGTGWDEASPDIDQPHGLDYREEQDIRKGVRKRINKEHVAFADATVGGEHKPGGCAVLGMDITDDCTAGVAADGTYIGKGLVWALSDASNWGVLFCATGDGTAPTLDWTVMRIHPDLQWGGGCITWAAGHEFDASVDISGNVAMDGDLTVDGAFALGGNAKIVGDCSVDSTFTVGGQAAFHDDVSMDADLVVDGTGVFTSALDISGTLDVTGGVVSMFGARVAVDSDAADLTSDTVYQAQTDGYVVIDSGRQEWAFF
ncbi:MAG: bactofilin family protein, partial [Planctomycetota bacterium]